MHNHFKSLFFILARDDEQCSLESIRILVLVELQMKLEEGLFLSSLPILSGLIDNSLKIHDDAD